jgi:hypothetical protein
LHVFYDMCHTDHTCHTWLQAGLTFFSKDPNGIPVSNVKVVPYQAST